MRIESKEAPGILILGIWNIILSMIILIFSIYVIIIAEDSLIKNFDLAAAFILFMFIGLFFIPFYAGIALLRLDPLGVSGTRSISVILICLASFSFVSRAYILFILTGCAGFIPMMFLQTNYVKEVFKEGP